MKANVVLVAIKFWSTILTCMNTGGLATKLYKRNERRSAGAQRRRDALRNDAGTQLTQGLGDI